MVNPFVRVAGLVLALGVVAAAAARAGETTVYSVGELRSALYAAQPGDRIYVAPGTYTSRLWVSGVHGTADNMIEVVALDPANRPVFASGGDSAFTIASSSYVLVDGIIAQNAGATSGNGNNFEFPNCHHMIAKNILSRNTGSEGNSDGTKFAGTSNMLMYNCRVENWGDSGSAVDIMNNANSLFMRNTIINGDMYNANGFQPKHDDARYLGFYKNTFVDYGARGQQFGGSSGATGWEGRYMVAMGSTFEGGEAPVAFVSCRDTEFAYNTILNPEKWIMRILNENPGSGLTSCNTFRRNLIQYDNRIYSIQNIGSYTLPATFTYAENYWYNSSNPGASIPALPGGESNPTGGVDPQLDADYRPHYGPARAYGAHAPQLEQEFQAYVSWFQWAWDKAQEYEPHADAGGEYLVTPGGLVILDGSASTPGLNSYGPNKMVQCDWDLDDDGEYDDASGQYAAATYDDLVALGLKPGPNAIGLRVGSVNEYGDLFTDEAFTILRLGLPGDCNSDGLVNIQDLAVLATNWNKDPAGWEEGNFNDDTVVNVQDLSILATNWTGGSASVPEPAGLSLLAAGAAIVLRRRKGKWARRTQTRPLANHRA